MARLWQTITIPTALKDERQVALLPVACDLLFNLLFVHFLLCFYFLLQLLNHPLQRFKFFFSRVLCPRHSFRAWAGKTIFFWVTGMERNCICFISRGCRQGRDIIVGGSPLDVGKVWHTLRQCSPMPFRCLHLWRRWPELIFKDLHFAAVGTLKSCCQEALPVRERLSPFSWLQLPIA